MRQDRGRESDSDTFRPHHQEKRQLARQEYRLFILSVVAGDVFCSLRIVELLLGKFRKTALKVSRRGGIGTGVQIAVVALPFDNISLALAPELVHKHYKSRANGLVSMRMVAHHAPDRSRQFHQLAGVDLPQGVEYAPLNGLETVLDCRDGSRTDHVCGVLHEV